MLGWIYLGALATWIYGFAVAVRDAIAVVIVFALMAIGLLVMAAGAAVGLFFMFLGGALAMLIEGCR